MTRHIAHVLNYGWPYIDGYTVRSAALVTAQAETLGLRTTVITSPFDAFAAGRDADFSTSAWNAENQIHATRHGPDGPIGPRRWERPALGVAPLTARAYTDELVSALRRVDADVVHAHHPHQNAAPALAAARRLGLPFVFELRCFNGDYDLDRPSAYARLRGRRTNALEFRVARAADRVVTIADGLAERLVAGGIPENRIHIVRNAVDTARFTPAPPRTADGKIRLGYATTFAGVENLPRLVAALGSLLRRRPDLRDRLRLTLAGAGQDETAIRAEIAGQDLDGIVDLPGFVPYSRMPAFLADLDLFVVPRGPSAVAQRTTPLKPLEALAVGRPVLATDLPAMRELMGGRDDVRFMEPDIDGMARGIETFVEAPWQATGDIGDRGWDREILHYRDIYDALPPRRTKGATGAAPSRLKRGLGRLAGLKAPEKLVVICGFPRAGSTLLQTMAEACLDGIEGFGVETHAIDAVGKPIRARTCITKRPDDILELARIRDACAARGTSAAFLVLVRAPFDCLTSRHSAYPGHRGYYLSADRWLRIDDAVQRAMNDDDVTILRYEDIVTRPADIQDAVARATGARVRVPFADFHNAAGRRERDSMTEGALGGLRPLDKAGIGRGLADEHEARRRELEAELGARLDDMRIRHGYSA